MHGFVLHDGAQVGFGEAEQDGEHAFRIQGVTFEGEIFDVEHAPYLVIDDDGHRDDVPVGVVAVEFGTVQDHARGKGFLVAQHVSFYRQLGIKGRGSFRSVAPAPDGRRNEFPAIA